MTIMFGLLEVKITAKVRKRGFTPWKVEDFPKYLIEIIPHYYLNFSQITYFDFIFI